MEKDYTVSWNIAGMTANRGEKRQVFFTPNGLERHKIPATLACGAKSGKTLCITAGVHSGEYPSIPATAKLAEELDPQAMTGNVLFLHCVNVSGFWSRSVSNVPEDGFNLNSGFPGDKNGTVGQKIVAFLAEEILPHVDFMLDLHSGSKEEGLTTCLFYTAMGNGESVEAVKDMAFALNYPYLIETQSTKSLFSYATMTNTPGLILERGCRGNYNLEERNGFIMDMKMAMEHLEISTWKEEFFKVASVWCRENTSLYASHAGLWFPAITHGEKVEKGQLLGRMTDFFGKEIATYHATQNGTIFYYMADLAVHKDEFLIYYGQ